MGRGPRGGPLLRITGPVSDLKHGSLTQKRPFRMDREAGSPPFVDHVAEGNTAVRMAGPQTEEQQYRASPHALNIAHYINLALATIDSPLQRPRPATPCSVLSFITVQLHTISKTNKRQIKHNFLKSLKSYN